WASPVKPLTASYSWPMAVSWKPEPLIRSSTTLAKSGRGPSSAAFFTDSAVSHTAWTSESSNQMNDKFRNGLGFGVGYDAKATVREMSESIAAAERAGFSMGFFSETFYTNRDSVSALSAFSLATQ